MSSSYYSDLVYTVSGQPINYTTFTYDQDVPDTEGVYHISYTFLDSSSISTIDYAVGLPNSIANYDANTTYAADFGASLSSAVEVAIEDILKTSSNFDPYSVFFGDVAQLSFSASANGDIAIGTQVNTDTTSSDALFPNFAVTVAPAVTIQNGDTTNESEAQYGDLFLNTGSNSSPTTYWDTVTRGGAQFLELLHELAHSLGLQHPDRLGPAPNDTLQYTIMTAAEQTPVGMSIFASGLQLDDIAAIQSIYGANYSIRDTNTVYGMNHGFGSAYNTEFIYTIWDGGGTNVIDATDYSYSGGNGAYIDLRQGAFSSIGVADSGVAQNNVAIAYGALIQNAIGTDSGDDALVGNAWNNILYGAAGNDSIYADGLTKDFDAGANWNSSTGSQWNNSNYVAPSTGSSVHDVLLGGAGDDILYAGKGSDVLHGGYDAFNIDDATTGWSTYWDPAGQFTGTHNIAGNGIGNISYSSDGIDTADYSRLYLSDASGTQSISTGTHGITVTFGVAEAVVQKGTIGTAGGADGTDYLFSIEKVVGTAGDDDFIGTYQVPIVGDALTLDGGLGHDHYAFDLWSSESDEKDQGIVLITDTTGGTVEITDSYHDITVQGRSTSVDGMRDILIVSAHPGSGSTDALDLHLDIASVDAGTGITEVTINGITFNAARLVDYLDPASGHSGTPEALAAIIGTIQRGASAADVLGGSTGADTLIGGAGDDTYTVDNAGDIIQENSGEGTDLVNASISFTLGEHVENLTLTGAADLSGTGNSDVNIIAGNSGANTLDGQAGADTLIGSIGNDVYVVDDAGDVVTENVGEGTDTIQSSITLALTSFLNVENLTLTGSGDVNATGSGTANIITGNSGNNTIDGGIGADSMIGGSGNDTYIVDNVGDTITENGSEGTDAVLSSVTYTLSANIESLTLAGTSNINGIGNSAVNVLTGNAGNNTLDGGAGADTMIGGGGDDTFFVDNAGDTVTGGSGTELISSSISYTLSSAVENLTLTGSAVSGTGNSLVNVITGTSGDNTLDGGAGADTMIGGGGNDTFFVDNAGDTVTGGSGTDLVSSSVSYTLSSAVEKLTLTGSAVSGTGNNLVNVITGNSGDNTLNGGTGADSLIGGGGNDTFVVDNTGDVVTAGSGADTIQSSISWNMSSAGHNNADIENLTLTGTANINATGNSLDNTITGNSGNNVLDGGTGADTLIGGAGNDEYDLDSVNDVVVEQSGGGSDLIIATFNYTLSDNNLENLGLNGSNLVGTGNNGANTISISGDGGTLYGLGGDDMLEQGLHGGTLIGGTGNDTYVLEGLTSPTIIENLDEGIDTVLFNISSVYTLPSNVENLLTVNGSGYTLTGNGLDNTIVGQLGNDTISGVGGNDYLDGFDGSDRLIGGVGNDTYHIDNAGDVVVENSGEGTDTVITTVNYAMPTNVESLILEANSITGTGGSGNDTLTAWGSGDSLVGGNGNDTYIVSDPSTVIVETSSGGTDTVDFTSISDGDTDILSTNVENLVLMGTAAINGTGNSSVNVITGNNADNTLNGGGGSDSLIGGLGDDTYLVNNTGITITENGGEGTDTVIASISGYTLAGNVEDLILTGASALTGTGNSADNVLTGNGVSGTSLVGGLGNDTYYLGASDTAVESSSSGGTDIVYESRSTYTLGTNVENLVLTGASNINGTGNTLANTITGNSGNNSLDGGTGADSLIGGLGDDTYSINVTTDNVIENANEGNDTVVASVTGYTLAANVENLTLNGVAAGTGNGLDNVITGNSLANSLDGGDGADTLIGGTGSDSYFVDNIADVVQENPGEGTDIVTFTNTTAGSTYTLSSDVEKLTLGGTANINGTGNDLVNTITGNSGNNTLDGGTGADSLVGGAGDDTFVVDNTSEIISDTAGTDSVMSSVTWTLGSSFENLILTGTSTINGTGNTGNNILIGNSAANILSGSSGNDTLDGGGGLDSLTGGTGTDTFIFKAATAFSNIDVVTDFTTSQTDKIDISDVLSGHYHSGTDNIDDFVQLVVSGSNTLLKVDLDGTGSTYSMAQIATLNAITGLNVDTLVANGELIVS